MKIIDIMPRVLPPKPGKKNKRHPSNSERAQKLVEFLTTNCGWTVLNRGTSKVLDTLIDNICEDIYDTYNTEGKSFSFAFLKNPANPNVTMYIDTDKLLAIKDIKKSTAETVDFLYIFFYFTLVKVSVSAPAFNTRVLLSLNSKPVTLPSADRYLDSFSIKS